LYNADKFAFANISGTKFLCSEVIAPVKSEVDDICLYILNFEDLTASTPPMDERPGSSSAQPVPTGGGTHPPVNRLGRRKFQHTSFYLRLWAKKSPCKEE
jgi:hypothetical protein